MDQVAEIQGVVKIEAAQVSESPLRAQYNAWSASMTEISANNPGVIKEIVAPDIVNNGLTLEEIDSRWNELEGTVEGDMLDLYEICKDYLVLPRIVDTFADSPDGSNERRKFRLKNKDIDPHYYDVLKASDLRLGPITGALGAVEFYGFFKDASNLLERQAAIISEITDADDPDRKEIYSRMSKDQKTDIAARVRGLAREVFFSEP